MAFFVVLFCGVLSGPHVHGVATLLLGGSGLRLHRGGGTLGSLVGGLACLDLPEKNRKYATLHSR